MKLSRCLVGTLLLGAAACTLGGCGGNDRPASLPASAYESTGNLLHGLGSVGTGASTQPPAATPTPAPDAWAGAAQLSGNLGDVTSFDGSDAIVAARSESSTSVVRIDAENTAARWWAMTQFVIGGTLRHPALVPGARLVFDGSGACSLPAGMAPLTVHTIGCSGPRMGSATYDHPADQVTLAVSAGPTADTRRMEFTATFVGASTQQVTGSFVYETSAAP